MRKRRQGTDGGWVSIRPAGRVRLYRPDPCPEPPTGADVSIPDRWKPETGPWWARMAGSVRAGDGGASMPAEGNASGCAASAGRNRPAGWASRSWRSAKNPIRILRPKKMRKRTAMLSTTAAPPSRRSSGFRHGHPTAGRVCH